MSRRTLLLLLSAALGAGGCSSDGAGGPAAGDGAGGPAPVPVWRDTSTRIDLVMTPGWHSSATFSALREQLTPAQQTALTEVRTLLTTGSPVGDGASYRLSISDADGSVAEYHAADGNPVWGEPTWQFVNVLTLQPLLSTLHCRAIPFALSAPTPAAEQTRDWQAAPTLSTADFGCFHSFRQFRCQDVHLWLQIESAGAYSVQLGNLASPLDTTAACPRDYSLSLLDAAATTQLTTQAAQSLTCPELRYTFPTAGKYALLIHDTAAECPDERSNSSYSVRLAPAQ